MTCWCVLPTTQQGSTDSVDAETDGTKENDMDSVNELLETLLDNYEASLTTDERRELKTLIEVYNRKNKK